MEEITSLDARVREAVAPLAGEGELIMQAVVVIEVMHEDGTRGLRTKATDMPWWQLNGLMVGGMITHEDVEDGP
jgi:hypothetical protein